MKASTERPSGEQETRCKALRQPAASYISSDQRLSQTVVTV